MFLSLLVGDWASLIIYSRTVQLESEDDDMSVITFLLILYLNSMSWRSISSSSIVSESLSSETVGWLEKRDSRTSVNAVNQISLSSKCTSNWTDASCLHSVFLCRAPQFLHLIDFCWEISLILRLHAWQVMKMLSLLIILTLSTFASFSGFSSNAGPLILLSCSLASLNVVVGVVPRWVIPWKIIYNYL